MAEMKNKPLQVGDRGVQVGNLQEQLNLKIALGLKVDNIFGSKTEAAVKEFQRRMGLDTTGIVDNETWEKLFKGKTIVAANQTLVKPNIKSLKEKETGYRIEINLIHRILTLFKDGISEKLFPVAIGKPATPTPAGEFTVLEKSMNPGGPFGSRWIRLTWNGIGIHGTNNPSSIGRAVSSGCIRMHNRDVESIYPLVRVGTPVRIIE